jgi:hypothetical protein
MEQRMSKALTSLVSHAAVSLVVVSLAIALSMPASFTHLTAERPSLNFSLSTCNLEIGPIIKGDKITIQGGLTNPCIVAVAPSFLKAVGLVAKKS